MADDEPVTFVRHSGAGFLGEQWLQDWLFEDDEQQSRIAVHYQSEASFDSSDYSNGGGRVARFSDAGQEPTIAVVAFSEYPSGEKYIAKTLPDTREIVVLDTNTQSIADVKPIESNGSLPEITKEYEGKKGYKIIKTIQVEDWKTIHQENNKLLWDWHSQPALHDPGKKSDKKALYIRSVYYGDDKPLIKEALDHRGQELIAEKHLRENYNNFTLDAPRGGKLENIDILGSAESSDGLKTVMASVTSSSGSRRRNRIEAANAYTNRGEVFFFDAEENRPEQLDDNAMYVSLEEVFQWMDENGTRRRRSLKTMLGLRDTIRGSE